MEKKMRTILSIFILMCQAAPVLAGDTIEDLSNPCVNGKDCIMICGMDGLCTKTRTPTLSLEGITTTTTSAPILTAAPTPSALDYVKAAAVIRWQAKNESGMVQKAMERAAELLEIMAQNN